MKRATRSSHYVCFECRKAFQKPVDVLGQAMAWGKFVPLAIDVGVKTYPCPQCGQAMTHMGKNFRAPAQADAEAWEVVRRLADAGFKHGYTQGLIHPQRLKDVPAFLEQHRQLSEGQRLLRSWPKGKKA